MTEPRGNNHDAPSPAMGVEEQYHLLMECVTDFAIFLLDPQGRIAGWNAGAERIFGYSEREILGEPFGRVFTPEDVEMGQHESELATALLTGRADDERWHLRKDGARFWATGVLTALRDPAGELRGYAKVTRDATARKRAEDKLREADRRKDEHLAMLAHELRNPLAAISNAVHLAKHSGSEDDVAWCLDTVKRQVRHLARITDDLLDVSRAMRGVITLRRESVDLASILHRAAEAARPQLSRRKHRLALELSPEAMRLDGDPFRLKQVFLNLLDNAARFTPDGGGVRVVARQLGAEIEVDVIDSGIGIREVMLPRVFDLFEQDDRSLDRSEGGLGIGLTLACTVVELHGGRVTAASGGPDRGSTFTVRLPAKTGPLTEASPPPASRPEDKATRGRILVVEDNVALAQGLARLLEHAGYEVHVAHDGPSGLETARRCRPHVALLDIGLPGMDGYELARRLAGEDGLGQVRLVAVTGYGAESDRARSLEAGFSHHLVKPVEMDELLGLLRREQVARDAGPGDSRLCLSR